MADKKFTEDHEWIEMDGITGRVGISAYAQEQLGDIVFVELPEVGTTFAKGDEVAVVESVKAASEVYAPVGGEVVAVNAALEGEPGLVNESAEEDGWFFEIKPADAGELDELMDQAAYNDHIAD
ncbi:MAG: glycine cleavage system protein GcvH [Alphaproteobacteria bacterium]